jgi:hypothetical protein
MKLHAIKNLFRPTPVIYVTRFSIAATFRRKPQGPVHLDPAWLAGRLALFERYCVPKMAAQTDPRFRWLILVDPETDDAIVKRLALAPNAEIVRVDPDSRLAPIIAARTAAMGDRIITVRLDSDDQISTTFTQALRAIRWDGRRCFALYYSKGLQLDAASGAYHAAVIPLNQFPAVFEHSRTREFVTVHAGQHNRLHALMDVVLIKTKRPMWCTVVHGGNAINRITGQPRSAPPECW